MATVVAVVIVAIMAPLLWCIREVNILFATF